MMREKYESLAVHDLKEIAKARGIKGLSTMKKAEVIDAMLRLDAQENAEMKTEPSAPKNRPAEREDAPKREQRSARMPRRRARQSARMLRRGTRQSARMLRRGTRQSARMPRRRAQWKSRILMTVGQNRRAEQGIGRKGGSREQESASSAMVLIIMDGQEAATTMVRGKILQLQRPVLLRLWQKRHRTV